MEGKKSKRSYKPKSSKKKTKLFSELTEDDMYFWLLGVSIDGVINPHYCSSFSEFNFFI